MKNVAEIILITMFLTPRAWPFIAFNILATIIETGKECPTAARWWVGESLQEQTLSA